LDGDDGQAALKVQCLAKCVRIVGLVGQQAARVRSLQKFAGRLTIMPLSLGDFENQRQSQSVDDQVNLGR
jgi:hypothetical protein